jgi:hypothetical protein
LKFLIHDSVLNDDDSVLRLIDGLIDRLADEVHWVELKDVDLLQESSWYQSARPTRRKVLLGAVARPPRVADTSRGPHVKTVEVFDVESVKQAHRSSNAPLVVLVEDREADGVLLDIIVQELGWPELKVLWTNGKAVTPRAIEIETAGGRDAIPQRVERAVNDAAEEGRPCRLFVLCDSDAKWPNDQSEDRMKRLAAVREACLNCGVPHHILFKRNAENYIPDQAFEAIRDDPRTLSNVDRFNAFLRRSPVQRNHFPVKDGLKPAERSAAIKAGLYDASEEEELKLLEERLLRKRPRPILHLNEERRNTFTADGLRARDGEGELDALLCAIAREL